MTGRAASYGIDGGRIALSTFGLAEAALAGATVQAVRHQRYQRALVPAAAAAAVAGSAVSYLYSSLRGKYSVWEEILDQLHLRGDEHLLDIGCGRGAVLLAAAKRLPAGRAVGVDIWRRRDQSGNTRLAAEHNAEAAGVKVEFVDADARNLPLPDGAFDIVVSSLTIHNIAGAEQRNHALREAVRVLRPGGRLRIVDQRVSRYPKALRAAGCIDIAMQPLDWRMWYGTLGDPLTLVSATKPGRDLPTSEKTPATSHYHVGNPRWRCQP